MNSPFEPHSFDEVLDAYLSASKIPNREVLADWIRKRINRFYDCLE
jgi:hypothetical protein